MTSKIARRIVGALIIVALLSQASACNAYGYAHRRGCHTIYVSAGYSDYGGGVYGRRIRHRSYSNAGFYGGHCGKRSSEKWFPEM